MYSPSERGGSQDNLLPSRLSYDFEFGKLSSLSPKHGCNDRRSTSPRQPSLDLIERLNIDEAGLETDTAFRSTALEAIYPDEIDWYLHHWGYKGYPSEGFAHWPTDATGDIQPIHCNSHNDYWRSVPLYAAIHAGCTGAEADVWLSDNELFVGHRRHALTAQRTLRNLYLNPLMELLEKQNPTIEYYPDDDYPLPVHQDVPLHGVFDADPTQTFVLLIDFKTSGPMLWWQLNQQLAPFREKGYLTYYNGTGVVERPITVVGTGNAPFDFLTVNEAYRDVFFDAPLEDVADLSSRWPNPNRAQDAARVQLSEEFEAQTLSENLEIRSGQIKPVSLSQRANRGQGRSGTFGVSPDSFNSTNSYYASASFKNSIGRIWGSRLTQDQLQLIRGHVRGAHQRGLKVRYWSVPTWPIGLRNHIWHILWREGVDMLNVDDLRQASQRDWRRRRAWGI
ncbi:Altered inheritance of mitochondria protein 6 [Exophiala xenobiotica]|uniref:Altered inheritance of mitochondria protein 6 n=1 Tax=Lithohypha guttulata TaxID=1690604 RepID=A0ABR0JV42_9EURO|nr:Altered inheritance of mitochondria protein 6 [Lithohypha guttulata]KAK5309014.1 Altered inheritance of mitochondria protein 6 [Exophiala xenobiotica]